MIKKKKYKNSIVYIKKINCLFNHNLRYILFAEYISSSLEVVVVPAGVLSWSCHIIIMTSNTGKI